MRTALEQILKEERDTLISKILGHAGIAFLVVHHFGWLDGAAAVLVALPLLRALP